jgi:hypothetical protein
MARVPVSQKSEVAAQAVFATPVAVGLGAPKVLGFEWSEITYALGAVYIVVQIGFLLHRWWRMAHRPNTFKNEEVE